MTFSPSTPNTRNNVSARQTDRRRVSGSAESLLLLQREPRTCMVDHMPMLVHTEKIAQRPLKVRVHTSVGTLEVLWRGDPHESDGEHVVEWTVDEDLFWGRNTRPAATPQPGFWQESDRLIIRGQLRLTEDGAAILQMGGSSILFDLASPIPADNDGSWIEVTVEADSVAVYPYRV
ncbi:hypothetical protein ACWDYH_21445 [Nocardia goodfellowii]